MTDKTMKHDAAMMFEYHQKLLLNLIRIHGPVSRVDLTKMTKLSPTTVGRIIDTILELGLIVEMGKSSTGLGRKAKLLDINQFGMYAIGIDMDMYNLKAGVVDLCGNILYSDSIPTPNTFSIDEVVLSIKSLVESLENRCNPTVQEKIAGVGITFPGNVSWPDGVVQLSPQFKWENVSLKEKIEEIYNGTVLIKNNVKSSANAEILFGLGKKYTNFVIFHCGSGIGSAVVLNGNVVYGSNDMFGEIGHIIVHPNGRKCSCGRRGCLQAYACMESLEAEAGITFSEIIRKSNQGDSYCFSLINEATDYISAAISNIINMYDPPLIILSGEMFDHYEAIRSSILDKLKQQLWKVLPHPPKIKFETSDYDSKSVISASSIIFQQCFDYPNIIS